MSQAKGFQESMYWSKKQASKMAALSLAVRLFSPASLVIQHMSHTNIQKHLTKTKITKAGHIFSNFRQAYWSMSTGCHHSVETTINFPLAKNCLLSLLVLSCTSNNSLFLFSKHSPFLFFSFPRTTYSQFPVFWLQLFLKKTL